MSEALSFPHSLDAERAVLGAVLVQGDRYLEAADNLTAEDFYRQAHGQIYRAMGTVAGRGAAIDLLTVKEALSAAGQLETVGGPAYISALVDGCPRSANIQHYARLVKEHSVRRRLMAAAEALMEQAADVAAETPELLDTAQQQLIALATEATESQFLDPETMARSMVAALEYRSEHGAPGLATGLRDLDTMTGGMQPGNLIVLAARPSMGKSALAMNIAWHVAVKERRGCLVFSLEMSTDELRDRMIGTAAKVPSSLMRTGRLHGEEWSRVSAACSALADGRLYVDDHSEQSSLTVRGKTRRFHNRQPVELVIVDYVQLMAEPRKYERKDLEVGAISRRLKGLAKELKVPVILISQLNRGPETRTDHRPTMADLRESGALEQDADMVWLLYREYQYKPTPENEHEAEVIVAKQRNGKTGSVILHWDGEFYQFGSRWAA